MFVVYSANHEIVATIIGPGEDYKPILQDGQAFKFYEETLSVNPMTDCLDPETLAIVPKSEIVITTDKPNISADGADVITITGIPNGAAVAVRLGADDYASEIVTDGEIEFSTTTTGVYTFLFTCPRYLPNVITVEAK